MQNFSVTDENALGDDSKASLFGVDELANVEETTNAFAVNFDSTRPSEMNITLIPTSLENPHESDQICENIPSAEVDEILSSNLNTINQKKNPAV